MDFRFHRDFVFMWVLAIGDNFSPNEWRINQASNVLFRNELKILWINVCNLKWTYRSLLHRGLKKITFHMWIINFKVLYKKISTLRVNKKSKLTLNIFINESNYKIKHFNIIWVYFECYDKSVKKKRDYKDYYCKHINKFVSCGTGEKFKCCKTRF